ncbi:Cytokinin riboside 5'-monophosphate phosphoribohydrolase [Psidium guajava]|nr:Cytokinin riboside 5'-monophosphate phosphoribohydrolase [Psidium guajava]
MTKIASNNKVFGTNPQRLQTPKSSSNGHRAAVNQHRKVSKSVPNSHEMILQVAEMERLNSRGVEMSCDGGVSTVMRISQDHSFVVGCRWSSLMRGQTISLVPSTGASLEFQLTLVVTVCMKNNEDMPHMRGSNVIRDFFFFLMW